MCVANLKTLKVKTSLIGAFLLALAFAVCASAVHLAPESRRQEKQEGGASTPEGKALLAKVVEGLGGETNLRSVRSTRTKSHLLTRTFMGDVPREIEKVFVFPDRLWEEVVMPGSKMSVGISSVAAFINLPTVKDDSIKMPKGPVDLPASQKEETLRELKSDPLFVAQHGHDPKFTFSAGGSQKVGEVEAKILDVNADGVVVRWLIDPHTGQILRISGHVLWTGGPGEQVIDLDDWKIVQGISVPFKATIAHGGQPSGWVEIKEFEINPRVDPKLFEKPKVGPGKE